MRLILVLLLIQSVAPAAVRDIVTRLRHAPEDGTEVPPAVASDLTALKHSLRDIISQTVNVAADVAPEDLQARVIAELERQDVPVGDDPLDEGGFGIIRAIKLARPREYPGWLVASVSLAVPYGDDTSLYVFQVRNGVWQLAITVESNGYNSILGAQGWLQYRVGRSSGAGVPFLVTTDHNPWPSSNWQGLQLKVFQIGPQPDQPLRLVRREFFYWISEPYQVSIRPGGFGLIYEGERADDLTYEIIGIHFVEYGVRTGAASLVSEIAVDPELIATRWAKAGWPIASTWVDPAERGEASEWHRRMRGLESACFDEGRLENLGEQLLVGVQCSGPADDPLPPGYMVLRATSHGFRIASISSTRPEWYEIYERPACVPAPLGTTHPTAEQTVMPKLPDGFDSGTVRLKVVAEADGSVSSVQVLDWPDRSGLVVPAIRAVRQWKFKPGTRDGCIVADWQTVDVVFKN
jgi:TonB family protein